MPPCCFTPLGSPLTVIGIGDLQDAVHRDAVEVGVQDLVRDRIELIFLHQHLRIAAARQLQRDERVGARLGVQNLAAAPSDRRQSAVASRLAPSPDDAVEHPGTRPAAARPPRFVLPECVARSRFEYGFHLNPCQSVVVIADYDQSTDIYTNNDDTDVSS